MVEISTVEELKSPVKRTAEQETSKKKRRSAYKRSVFNPAGKLESLHNMNGILVSIAQGRENGAGRELFNLIIDAADRLKLDYDELNFPFKIVDLGIRCLLFVDLGQWSPHMIVDNIFNNVCGSQQQHVKFVSRIVPCKLFPAELDTIIKNAELALGDLPDKITFAVDFKSRYCEKFKQRHKFLIKIADALLIKYNGGKEVSKKEYLEQIKAKKPQSSTKSGKAKKIDAFGEVKEEPPVEVEDEIITVPNLEGGKLKVDLNNPDVLINVEVFKTVVSVSALKNYRKYRKYNLNLVANEGFLE
eukprot:NODE_85_length_22318_cov_0.288492.p6 type:complete len:302 gc:universal NODE_85_length_22318_cov_0.288492:7246-8151(+)